MMALAVAFGWAWGLSDWRIGEACGLSEFRVLQLRRELGLRKTGGGQPVWREAPPRLQRGGGPSPNVNPAGAVGSTSWTPKGGGARVQPNTTNQRG